MVAIRITVEGTAELQRRLRLLNPEQNQRIMRDTLKKSAFAIQRNVTRIQLVGGGRGKGRALPALPSRLTSRTGTLRRSVAVNQRPLPRAIEIGTDLSYGAVHEVGGRISVPASRVKSHTRTVAFGRKVGPFTVPAHMRSAYTANYPRRPFLQPALETVAPRFPGFAVEMWERELRR